MRDRSIQKQPSSRIDRRLFGQDESRSNLSSNTLVRYDCRGSPARTSRHPSGGSTSEQTSTRGPLLPPRPRQVRSSHRQASHRIRQGRADRHPRLRPRPQRRQAPECSADTLSHRPAPTAFRWCPLRFSDPPAGTRVPGPATKTGSDEPSSHLTQISQSVPYQLACRSRSSYASEARRALFNLPVDAHRHARTCSGHPRSLPRSREQPVDGRDKPTAVRFSLGGQGAWLGFNLVFARPVESKLAEEPKPCPIRIRFSAL